MKIFLDFDDCLIDTWSGVVERMKDVAERHGVSREVFQGTLEKHFSGAKADGGKTYHPDDHCGILFPGDTAKSEKVSREIFSMLGDLRTFVFSDAVGFLESFPKEDLFLLTYGNTDFQRFKVRASGLDDFFNEIIVTDGDKMEVIHERLERWGIPADEPVFFLDDRTTHFSAGAENRERVRCLHVKRPGKEHFSNVCDDGHDDVSDLSVALEMIRK